MLLISCGWLLFPQKNPFVCDGYAYISDARIVGGTITCDRGGHVYPFSLSSLYGDAGDQGSAIFRSCLVWCNASSRYPMSTLQGV